MKILNMNDFTNIPRHDTYCPDLSDMRDEFFGFWDFLNEKSEPKRNHDDKCNDTKTTEVEFWNFIGPSVNCSQSESQLKTIDHLTKISNCTPSYSNVDESGNSHLTYNISNSNVFHGSKSTTDICPKPPDNADDEFWDFLKFNSPIKNFQEVFEAYETPFSSSNSFNPLNADSGFQSPVSIISNVPSMKSSNNSKQNVQLRYQNGGVKTKNINSIDEHRRISGIQQNKMTYNRKELFKSVDENYTTSTPKPSKKIYVKRCASDNYNLPVDKLSKLTDDEFWDFLNCDSPIVKFSDALRELPSVNKEPSTLSDSGFSLSREASYKESPFAFVSNAADSGRNSVESDATTCISINTAQHLANEKHMNYNIKKNSIKNSLNRYHHNQLATTTKSTSSGYNSTSVTTSSLNKTYNTKNKVQQNAYNSVCTTSQNKMPFSGKTKPSENSSTKLPCISSVFSVSMYPDWLNGSTQLTVPTCSQSTATNESYQNPGTIIADNRMQGKKFRTDEVGECSKRNRRSLTPLSPIGCSQFNEIDTNDILNLNTNETDNDNLDIHKNQISSNALNSDINSAQFKQNPTTSQPVTATTSAILKNSTINNSTNNSKNLYLVLPQNQNYSHFLVLLNNTTELAKPLSDKSSISSSKNSLKKDSTCDPIKTASENQKSNNLLNIPVHNLQIQSMNSNANVILHSESSNVGKQTFLHKNAIQSNTLTTSNGINCATNAKSLENFATVSNITNLSAGNNILISLNGASTTRSVSSTIFSNQDVGTQNLHQHIQRPLNTFKAKMTPSKVQRPIIKHIKSISLGKDKNAILQTSTPLKMESITENKHLCDAQGNVINYFYDSNTSSSLPQSNFPSYEITETLNNKISKDKANRTKVQSSAEVTITTRSTKNHDLANVVVSEIGNSSSLKADFQLKNICALNQSKNQLLNPTAMSISETELLNSSITSSNSYKLGISNTNISTSCISQKQPNNYLQIKVAPAQQNSKSFSNLQELFPPPISMVPVCVVPKTQTVIQQTVPKVLILKGLGQQQQSVRQNSQPKPDPSTQQPTNDKKSAVKPKKTGRKTVRELLEERQQSVSAQSGNKWGKELRVLRPVQKIPTSSTFYPTILPNNKSTTGSSSGMTGNATSSFSYGTQQTDISKRPNILMLPSACKAMKKNIIKDETKSAIKMKGQEALVHSPDFEVSQQGHQSYRPRHYDMSELQIGYFKVDDDMDSCGRFRSKFKVIFSKRQFLYEFPVCRCNQVDLKSSEIWEQMVRIVVPFQIITSMDLSDRTIHFHINSTPLICLGRVQARSGIISNPTVYDMPVEGDSSWGNAIRSSFIHKIVLRKRQVNKLKTFLYQFDEKFIGLTNNKTQGGIYSSNPILEGELSPATLKKSFTKNKKSGIRRLPQWDSPEQEEEEIDEEIEILKPQMCSCRISCRSVRCSCAKAAKSCSSVCLCINCGNPLNVLESIGINIELALKDRCLFQNIYRIPNLLDFLLREIKMSCCNTFARVECCIPGTVLCPNIDCNVQLEFSWCRVIVCYPERNPRNHCSLCGQCCFSNGRHCMTCNRCYVKTSSKFPHCPTCQEKTTYDANFNSNAIYQTQFPQTKDLVSSTKLSTKPEIILLDAYSIPKDSIYFENMDGVIETASEVIRFDTAEDIQDEISEVFITEQMDFTVEEA